MEERQLLEQLRKGNRKAFSVLFTSYYKDLVMFAGTLLAERDPCEDIVQSVFLKIWEERKDLYIETSFKSYLLTAVRNRCLDEIRHRQIRWEHEESVLSCPILDDVDTENYVLYSDLYVHLKKALDKLPAINREAFMMNRFGNLKYREIAARLSVSERTVEVRIGKALELLRHYLKDFLLLFFLVIVLLRKLYTVW